MSQKKADVRGHQCRSDDPPRRSGRSHIPPILLTSSPQLNSTYQFELSHSQAAAGSYGEPPIKSISGSPCDHPPDFLLAGGRVWWTQYTTVFSNLPTHWHVKNRA